MTRQRLVWLLLDAATWVTILMIGATEQ